MLISRGHNGLHCLPALNGATDTLGNFPDCLTAGGGRHAMSCSTLQNRRLRGHHDIGSCDMDRGVSGCGACHGGGNGGGGALGAPPPPTLRLGPAPFWAVLSAFPGGGWNWAPGRVLSAPPTPFRPPPT